MAGAQEIDISYDPDTGAFVSGVLSRVKWDSLNVSYGIPWDQSFYGSDYVRTVDPEGDTVGPTEVDETNGFVPLNGLQIAAVEAAVREVMALTNLVLTRNTIDPGQTDIRFGMTTTPKPTSTDPAPMPSEWTAYASLPFDGWEGGEIWFNTVDYNSPTPGSYAYQTFFHEFGHALGLKHGHEASEADPPNANTLPAGFDSLEFSTMTYSSYVGGPTDAYKVRPGDYPMTYMLADIAALQYMYGANFNTNSGATVYRFSNATGQMSINGAEQEAAASEDGSVSNTLFRTIWDGGGIDTYDFSLYGTALDVNLAPGLWTDVDRSGTTQAALLNDWEVNNLGAAPIHARGQVFNALLYYGNTASLIENAIGGTNADILRGNFGANTLEGRNANDTLDGDAGNDWLDGGFGDDVLEGRGGADTLVGDTGTDTADYRRATAGVTALLNQPSGYANGGLADGTDTLIGIENLWGSVHRDVFYGDGGGNWLWGAQGNDLLGGQGGADLLQGDVGDDSLLGGEGDDILDGGDDDDTLEGGGGYNTFYGGLGNDVLRSGAAEEVLDGGDGFDIADYSGSPTRILIDLRIGTGKFYGGDAFGDTFISIEAIQGSAHDDVMNGGEASADIVFGGSGNDSFAGHGANDSLYGENQADTLVGGAGDDLLDGGDGDDVLIGGEGADTIRGGDGFDVVSFEGNGLWIDLNGAGGGDVLSGVEGAAGTAGNDTVIGTGAGNFILGGAGDDDLYGGFGADTLQGGDGWDYHDGGDGPDMVSYRDRQQARNIDLGFDRGDGTYGKISGDDSGDTFVSIEDVEGTLFNDTIVGNAGFNILYGLDGDDELRSDDGDALWGGEGNDSFVTNGLSYAYGEDGQDAAVFTGTAGAVGVNLANQSLNSGAAQFGRFFGIETFYGTADNDTFAGGAGPVAFYGLTGSDILWGSTADDTLGGGIGSDHIDGGFGFDIVEYLGDTAGVLVDLRAFIAAGGEAAGDTVWGMEGIGGGSGNDSLGGTDFANQLWGRDGNDYMSGYADVDALWGGKGADSIEGGAGADYVDGGEGNDLLGDNEQVVLLFATDDLSADTLLGGDGEDTLLALSGDDLLDGGEGADSMAGGAGNDLFLVDDAGDVVLDSSGADTVIAEVSWTLATGFEVLVLAGSALTGTGNGLNNQIIGNALDNTLIGANGADTLSGGIGNDSLNGSTGADSMAGGAGNDSYLVDNLADIVTENASGGDDGGLDEVRSSVTFTLGDFIEQLTLIGAAAVGGTGNGLGNFITGNAAANLLQGLDGADTLDGGAGADTLQGGQGNDVLLVDDAGDVVTELAGGGIDVVRAVVNHTLGANVENLTLFGAVAVNANGNGLANVIIGNGLANTMLGANGNDTLIGQGGSDLLNGGTGADSMAGGTGADRYIVDNIGDAVVELGGEGDDSVVAGLDWTLGDNVERLSFNGSGDFIGIGNALGNRMSGNGGDNWLQGEGGNDVLLGQDGADTLFGGGGRDLLTGGAAADLFLFAATGEGIDRIFDFAPGVDRIGLVQTGFVGLALGVPAAANFVAHASSSATSAFGTAQVIYNTAAGALFYDADGLGGADAVRLVNLDGAPVLSASDIIVV